MMTILGNVIWMLFGGIVAFLAYAFAGLLLCFTIIGIPWGLQCFKLAVFVLAPFGKTLYLDPVKSVWVLPFNIIWFIFAGLWIAAHHLVCGLLLFITIIGIPFAIPHFKLMRLAIWPFGQMID